MKSYTVDYGSKIYLPVQIWVTKQGEPYDPTGDNVQVAVTLLDVDPIDADWKDGDWDQYELNAETVQFARILIGPGGDVSPIRGNYDIHVKIFDSPEIPVIRAGVLIVK